MTCKGAETYRVGMGYLPGANALGVSKRLVRCSIGLFSLRVSEGVGVRVEPQSY
jgi:hypothetical protein